MRRATDVDATTAVPVHTKPNAMIATDILFRRDSRRCAKVSMRLNAYSWYLGP